MGVYKFPRKYKLFVKQHLHHKPAELIELQHFIKLLSNERHEMNNILISGPLEVNKKEKKYNKILLIISFLIGS